MRRWAVVAFALAIAAAAACSDDDGGDQSSDEASPATDVEPTTTSSPANEIDLTRLPVGDGNLSTDTPAVGVLCTTQPTNGQGAETMGPWFNGDGTWNLEEKFLVDGEVDWPHEFTETVQGDTRTITSNGLPDYPTGTFPVAADDDAAQIDRNPGEITAQDLTVEVPANPEAGDTPVCVGGEIGIGVDGVVINNAIDAAGRDALAWEVEDACQGHPHGGGLYHHHSVSTCIEDSRSGEGGHSDLAGYALDGFGIFGHYGEDGEVLTNEDLDECHGHAHEIEWDDETVAMFHYHATYEFPYTVGCFRGTTVAQISGLQMGDAGQGGGAPPGPPGM